MGKTSKPVLQVLNKETPDRLPMWFMRQAGRYLPEYHVLKNQAGSFMDLCLTPELASEITLQPLKRFDLDAAILFSDILMVPYGLGQDLAFEEGVGPILPPIKTKEDLNNLSWRVDRIEPIFKTLELTRTALNPHQTLIGFAGSLWTVACYMVEGHGSKTAGAVFQTIQTMAAERDPFLEDLMELLITTTLRYLARQIEAGAEVIHLFDSWAGLLEGDDFYRFVTKPTQLIIESLRNEYPDIPVIAYVRGASEKDLEIYARETGISALSLDGQTSLSFAKNTLQPIVPLQGNLDPDILITGGALMEQAVDEILESFGKNHIINLSHGIKPKTPVERVEELVRYVRSKD